MVAAFLEELVALVEGGFEGGGVFDGLAEDGSAEGVEGASGGVDDDEAEVGEGGSDEARKGGGEGGVGRIGGGEEVEFGSATDEFGGAVEDGGYVGAEREIADGLCSVGMVEVQAQGVKRVTRGQGDVIGFGEVVIFGGEPEDGDGVRILGAADDGGGFEEGEEGSAEEGDLLAGDDGAHTPASELAGTPAPAPWRRRSMLARVLGGLVWVGKPAAILFEEKIGEGGAVGGILMGDGISPGLRPRGGDEEGGKRFVARGVVEEEPALPGQHRDGITVDLHGRA